MTPTPAASARARSSGSASRAAPSTGSPFSNSPGMHLAVGVDEIGAGEPVDGGAERHRQHRGGVGRQAGREVGVDDDHAAFRSLSGHRAPP